MRLAFTKMHGLGNDFIVFEAATETQLPSGAELRRLADRRTGIGFDQALVLMPPRDADTEVYYRVFNADGSEVEQCGNGARCIASLVGRRIARSHDGALAMGSPGGRVDARLRADGLVSVAMGVPDFEAASLPFIADAPAKTHRLQLEDGPVEFSVVSIGNPHAVLTVPAVEAAAVDRVGAALENHARFPRRVNVGFMQIVDSRHIRLRVFERGVGETRACGTGACAAVVVGSHFGPLEPEVQVELPGGRLLVQWAGPGEPVWLTGPAETVFEGQIDVHGVAPEYQT